MNKMLNELSNIQKYSEYIKNIKDKKTPIILSGLTDISKNIFISSTSAFLEKNICVITYNEIQAKNIIKDLKNILKNEVEVVYFPKREIMSYDYEAQSKEIYAERIRTLNKIYSNKASIVVTTIEAVSQKMISKEVLYKNVLELKTGKRYDVEKLKKTLVYLGYERFELIEGKGQFGVRGGIIDIAISSEKGVRVEFFDDEIDSIRYFNIQSQRSTEMIKEINIYPAYEFVLERSIEEIADDIKVSISKSNIKNEQNKITNKKEKEYLENVNVIERKELDIEEILKGQYVSKVDRYFNSFYKTQVSFLEYLQDDTIIFLDEIEKIKARIENIKNDTDNVIKLLIEKEKIVPDALRSISDFYEFYGGKAYNTSISTDSTENNINTTNPLDNKVIIHLLREEILGDKEIIFNRKANYISTLLNEKYKFLTKEVNFFRSTIELFIQELRKATEEKKHIIILNETEEIKEKVINLLQENNISGNIEYEIGNLSTGVEIFDFNMIIITTKDLFEIKKERRKYSTEFKEGQHVKVDDLKIGDFVVHKNQGISQFIGINTIRADGVTKDYIKLKFADDRNIICTYKRIRFS